MPARIYFWSEELDRRLRLAWALRKRERTAAVSALVAETGWPRHAFKNRAGWLGLNTERRRRWTKAQDERLLLELGSRSVKTIARDMGRSYTSVKARAEVLRLSCRITDGYTKNDVRRILGAPWRVVTGWIERGWMGPVVDGRVSEEWLVAFIYRHLDDIDFRLADQNFLKGVFRDGKRKGLSKPGDAGAARGGGEAKDRSRRSAGSLQGALAFDGGNRRDREGAQFVGQAYAAVGASA